MKRRLPPLPIMRTVVTALNINQNFGFGCYTRTQQQQSFQQQRRFLNRFLFDPEEVRILSTTYDKDDDPNHGNTTQSSSTTSTSTQTTTTATTFVTTLPSDDYRTIHAAKTLRLINGDTVRAGIIQQHFPNPWSDENDDNEHEEDDPIPTTPASATSTSSPSDNTGY